MSAVRSGAAMAAFPGTRHGLPSHDARGGGGGNSHARHHRTHRSVSHAKRPSQDDSGTGKGGTLTASTSVRDASPVSSGRADLLTADAARRLRRSSIDSLEDDNRAPKWYIIMPHTGVSYAWELVVLLPLMYTCTMLPVVVCFVEDVTEPWETLDWIVTAVFAVDIIVTFFSAFRNKDKVLVTDLHAIAINYLQFWFWIDLVATLPFGVMDGSASSNQLVRLSRLPRAFRLLKLVRLLRLARAARLKTYVTKLEAFLNLTPSFARFFRTIFWALVVTHLAGSLWHFIALQEGKEGSWIAEAGLLDTPVSTRYVASIYWAFATLTSVGYGDIAAVTVTESLFAILIMGTGLLWAGLMVGNIMSIVATLDRASARQAARVSAVARLVRGIRGLNPRTRVTMEKWAEDSALEPRNNSLDVVRQMPDALRRRVVYNMYRDTIQGNSMLKAASPSEDEAGAAADFCYKGEMVTFQRMEKLFEPGTPCRFVYLVVKGMIALTLKGKDVSVFDAGDICGLADALFTSTHVTGATALEEVHALEITRQELHTVISGYPVLRREFTRVARQTVEALGLPITLPQSEEEAKQEALAMRKQALSSAVRGGLWRNFASKPLPGQQKKSKAELLKALTDAGLSPVMAEEVATENPDAIDSGDVGAKETRPSDGGAAGGGTAAAAAPTATPRRGNRPASLRNVDADPGTSTPSPLASAGAGGATSGSGGPSSPARAVYSPGTFVRQVRGAVNAQPNGAASKRGPGPSSLFKSFSIRSGAPALSTAGGSTGAGPDTGSGSSACRNGAESGAGAGAGAAPVSPSNAARHAHAAFIRRGSGLGVDGVGGGGGGGGSGSNKDVLLALMQGQRQVVRGLKTNQTALADSLAMLADQMDGMMSMMQDLQRQIDVVAEAVG